MTSFNQYLQHRNTVCNTLRGSYDGTLFPQNISKNEEFRVYRKAFCRTLPIRFDHASQLHGLEAYHFELVENAFDTSMDDLNSSCFCSEKRCLQRGLGKITPCYYSEYDGRLRRLSLLKCFIVLCKPAMSTAPLVARAPLN